MIKKSAFLKWLPGQGLRESLLIGVAVLAMLPGLGSQPLDYFDEVKTGERSRSFTLSGDWLAVQENGRASFNKPPLHYWITAGFLQTPMQPEIAVRLLAAICGILCVFLTMQFARMVRPEETWLPFISAALLMLYGPFVEYARVGVLDTGATALLLGALICSFRALGNPVYWYGVAGFAILGSLHKTPLVLLVWIVFIAGIVLFSGNGRIFRSKHLWIAFVLGVLGVATWPVLQSIRFGDAYLNDYGEFELKQMVSRDRNLGPATYLVWMTKKWFLFAWVGLAGAVWLLVRKSSQPELRSVMMVTLIFFIVASCLTGHSHRYLFPILPLLAIAIGVVGRKMASQFPVTAAVFLIANVVGAGITTVVHRGLDHRGFDDQLPLIERFRVLDPTSDQVAVVRDSEFPATIFTYFTRFYAGLEKPTLITRMDSLHDAVNDSPEAPTYVFCSGKKRNRLVTAFPDAEWLGNAGENPEIHLFRLQPTKHQ